MTRDMLLAAAAAVQRSRAVRAVGRARREPDPAGIRAMNYQFRIHKTHDSVFPWAMDYPDGFSDGPIGVACSTFEFAVAEFVKALERQCPHCLKGAVVDTDYGWKCEECGMHDVAVNCEEPR